MLVKLDVAVMKRGRYFIAYSPALDLSTFGKSLKEAKSRFAEILDIFFQELEEANTLDAVLDDLGWVKVKKQWEPPQVVSQQSFNVHIPVGA